MLRWADLCRLRPSGVLGNTDLAVPAVGEVVALVSGACWPRAHVVGFWGISLLATVAMGLSFALWKVSGSLSQEAQED